MSARSCCIAACSCTINSCQLFRFPGSQDRRKIWLDLVKPYSPNVADVNAPRICRHHFEDQYLRGRRRLHKGYPTLFTPKEIETRAPDNPINICFSGQEPSYAVPTLRNYGQSSMENIHPPISWTVETEVPKETMPSSETSRIAEEAAETSSAAEQVASTSGTSRIAEEAVETSSAAEQVAPTSRTTITGIHEEPPVVSTNSGTCLTIAGRQRLVQSVQKLTPKCKRLYSNGLDIMKSKKRLDFSCKKKVDELKKLCDKNSFDSLIEGMTPEAKTFLQMQINQCNKHMKRRRFSNEEKIFALSIMKQSPKGYRFLRKLFVLPSKVTLNKFTKNMSLSSGLNAQLLSHLEQLISSWDNKKKLCSIVFDEVALTPHLNFVESHGEIEGFVNFGQNKERKLCDHALVVMLRGVCTSWTQPIAYYMCEGATPAVVLKNILRDVVDAAVKIGLKPMAVICDQGSTFLSCTKSFQEETRRQNLLNDVREDNKININGHKLNIIYDPPHLIKGIRNNFLTKDMVFRGKVARWDDIVEVYKADCELGDIRLLHKLTDEHVIPAKIKKMKVKYCTRNVFK